MSKLSVRAQNLRIMAQSARFAAVDVYSALFLIHVMLMPKYILIIMLQGEENPDNPLQRTIVGPRAGRKTLEASFQVE